VSRLTRDWDDRNDSSWCALRQGSYRVAGLGIVKCEEHKGYQVTFVQNTRYFALAQNGHSRVPSKSS
jgi:hypothetical protein